MPSWQDDCASENFDFKAYLAEFLGLQSRDFYRTAALPTVSKN